MPPSPPADHAVRKFAAVQAASLAIKVGALVALAAIVLHFWGGL